MTNSVAIELERAADAWEAIARRLRESGLHYPAADKLAAEWRAEAARLREATGTNAAPEKRIGRDGKARRQSRRKP